MANINTELEQIRKAVYGREVRGSIANAIELINKEQVNTSTAQTNLDSKFEQLIINAGNSNAEVVAARVKADGTQFSTLSKRLDKGDEVHNALNNEVISARTDSKNVVHKNLKTRLDHFDSELDTKANLKLNSLQNKFNKNNITAGKFQNADGTIIDSSSHIIAQLTNAENVKTVIIKNPIAIGLRLSEYDAQGNFIIRTSKTTTELIINLNANTKYIRFGCNKVGLNTVRMFFIEKDKTYNTFDKTLTENNTLIANSKDINIEQYYFIDEKVKTKYWITHIPRTDEKGNINELKLGFANNMIDGDIFPETARSFANRNNATVCINAGVSWSGYNGNSYYNKDNQKCNKMHGLRVYEHMLVSNDIESNWYKKTHWALGIKDDGTLVSFGTADSNGDMTMSYEQSQQLGCKFVTSAFTPVMLNNISQKDILKYKNQWVNDDGSNVYYQRQVIAQNSQNKDIFILTSNGKGTGTNSDGLIIDGGMPLDSCISILQNFGCDFAYQLDEGGSTSLIYQGVQINDKTDDGGKTERLLSDFLYVTKVKSLADIDSEISYLKQELGELKNNCKKIDKLFLESESDNTREIQRWVNGSLKHSLNLKNFAIQYYDSVNKKTIFQADTTGLLSTLLGVHGFFPKELKSITSETFPAYSTCFVYPSNIGNAPFSVNAFVIHLTWGSGGGQIQIAIPYTSNTGGDLYPKWRTKTTSNGTLVWNAWNKFSSV